MSTAIRGQVVKVGTELVTETCYQCGVLFAMSGDFRGRRLDDHQDFYCPAGHPQHYTGQNEAERLREQLDAEKRRTLWYTQAYDQHTAEIRDLGNQLRAQKAAKSRILNRVQNGVCPHCRRHFMNVERHMATKHPGAAEGQD